MTYDHLDPTRLTPGVLDGDAVVAFRFGACGALAIALHDATGWPIVAITDHDNVFDGHLGMGSAMHWAVLRLDGKVIDVDGAHDPDELVAEYHAAADDGQAALARARRRDALEWYYEGGGKQIPLSLAATFVAAVLQRAGTPEQDLRRRGFAR